MPKRIKSFHMLFIRFTSLAITFSVLLAVLVLGITGSVPVVQAQMGTSIFLPGLFAPGNVEGAAAPHAANPMLHADGMDIVDGQGNRVVFRGMNAEGWLQLQGHIIGAGLISETDMVNRLATLAGAVEANRFREGMYTNFLTEKDFALMQQSGMNAVRIPINHRALETESGWSFLDNAILWGERYNVYILLDLHAAPGGQSSAFVADPEQDNLLWQSDENKKRPLLFG